MGDQGYLSQNDTIMWTIEADPLLRTTIVGVVLLERAPDWEQLRRRVEYAANSVPVLSKRVANVPLRPTTLRWVPAAVDLDFHLRRVKLPGRGGMNALLDWARADAAGSFDLARPLWRFTLVEGVGGGRAALVLRTHHVVTDGIGAVQLAAHLFEFEPESSAPPPTEAPTANPPSSLQLLTETMFREVGGVLDLARRRAGSLLPDMLRAVRDPVGTVTAAADTAASAVRLIALATTPKSPMMVERTMVSNFRAFDVAVADLRDAARRAGGHLNDAFLAGITTGLRQYHRQLGTDVDELRVAMPISQRSADHAAGGNHVTIVRFVMPVGETARERIGIVRDVVGEIRHERALNYTEPIAGFLNLMPRGVVGAVMRGVDFLASNVPGVNQPIYLCGAPVTAFYPFGPTVGSAVNISLMSYDGTCHIGVNADAAAVEDPDLLIECLEAGFAEVCAV